MAGILDKKSRLFDYQITTDGRKQIQNNDLRFVYASFSDKSIVYTKNDILSEGNKSVVDGSEFYFLPLESTTKENSTLVNEFKFVFNESEKSYKDSYEFVISAGQTLLSAAKEKVTEISIGTKINNEKIILTKSGLSPDTFSFKINAKSEDGDFNFRNSGNINTYPTILNASTAVSNLEPIYNDKRFFNKTNFMKMPPVNSENIDIFSRSSFKGLDVFDRKSNIDFMFKSFDEKITFQNEDDREKSIKDMIDIMSMSKEFIKKEYHLVEEDNADTFFIEMFEAVEKNNIGSLEKLLFIKLDEIYDNYKNAYKDVYLVGKLKYNNRESNIEEEKEKLKEELRRFNLAYNNSDGYEFRIYKLANLFSFVNMFVIVAE